MFIIILNEIEHIISFKLNIIDIFLIGSIDRITDTPPTYLVVIYLPIVHDCYLMTTVWYYTFQLGGIIFSKVDFNISHI